jgi:hypothetical protein
MASKKKHGKQRGGRRPGIPAQAPGPVEGVQAVASAAPSGATPPAPRYASAAIAPRRSSAGAATASIDIDARVPYFTGDLRRIGMTAGVLIAGIVVASFLLK